MESEMKFNLIQRLQTGAKNVPSIKHLAAICFFLCRLFIVKNFQSFNQHISKQIDD